MMYDKNLPDGCLKECNACKHKYFSDEESLQQKENFVHSKLSLFTEHVSNIRHTNPYLRFGYRNKACLACFHDGTNWQAGIHKRDTILSIPDCPLHSKMVRETWKILSKTFLPASEFPLHWYAQCGKQVVLVLKTKLYPNYQITNEIAEKLTALGIDGLWLHRNPSTGRKVFGKVQWDLIWGISRSKDETGLEYGPIAFQQALPALYNEALAKAAEFLSINKNTQIVDLYTGIGASITKWENAQADVLGVELCGEAVECAYKNISTANILRGKCSERIPQINQWLKNPHDFVLFANPPRTGLEKEVIDWLINEVSPLRIAYLSCSPSSLQRNLEKLSSHYRLCEVIPFDFFPNTHHVETLVLLENNQV